MGRTAKISPQQVLDGLETYWKKVEESKKEIQLRSGDIKTRYGFFPSMASLAYHLGVSRGTIDRWIDDKFPNDGSKEGEEYTALIADSLARTKAEIEMLTVTSALNGDVDAKTATLILNGFGYRDKVEHELTGDMAVAWQGLDPETAKKYSK